jgi:hypothetical protein
LFLLPAHFLVAEAISLLTASKIIDFNGVPTVFSVNRTAPSRSPGRAADLYFSSTGAAGSSLKIKFSLYKKFQLPKCLATFYRAMFVPKFLCKDFADLSGSGKFTGENYPERREKFPGLRFRVRVLIYTRLGR